MIFSEEKKEKITFSQNSDEMRLLLRPLGLVVVVFWFFSCTFCHPLLSTVDYSTVVPYNENTKKNEDGYFLSYVK